HDELQALVAGLAGVALEGGDELGIRVAGVSPIEIDGAWREGFIVNPTRQSSLLCIGLNRAVSERSASKTVPCSIILSTEQCVWCEVERTSARRLEPGKRRGCPACEYVFSGSGWDGIDAHWKGKHGAQMPYAAFWNGIRACSRHHR